jgi:serine/threonine protein kinase
MGVVYEAEQESPRREVALKLIRGGLTGPESLRRFRFEAEVLGQLQHPGIARIFEAGTTDVESDSGHSSSQPFLAMELVRGQSLLAYASERSLSVGERLLLTAEISEAVHHAHQKGVIHRDLKPGNILVDATGPKILDFGVARATNPNLATGSLAMGTLAMGTLETGAGNESGSGQETGAGQLIGTVAYMSPERLESRSGAGDTSGDVYALGVVGYELLTGRLPFDVAGKPISQAIRIV